MSEPVLINAIDLQFDELGNVTGVHVTDNNTERYVTPLMIFRAITGGRMTSQNIALNIYGLDILLADGLHPVMINLSASDRKVLKEIMNPGQTGKRTKSGARRSPSQPRLTAKQKEDEEKKRQLEIERQAYLEKQKAWMEENKRKADEARAKGLMNLSMDERRQLRAEALRK